MIRRVLPYVCLLLLAIVSLPQTADACSACYGKSDSDLARGMNWGILTLLVVVGSVLGGIAAFFIYLAKRSAAMAGKTPSPLTDATHNLS